MAYIYVYYKKDNVKFYHFTIMDFEELIAMMFSVKCVNNT